MPPSIATPLSSGTARELYGVRALPPVGVVPFGYTGQAEDPTGLTWGRARCYAPRTGGWTGEDPVFTEPRYAYVGGSPSYGVDPTGRLSYVEKAILTCAIVGVMLAFAADATGGGDGAVLGGYAGGFIGCMVGPVATGGLGGILISTTVAIVMRLGGGMLDQWAPS